ncbi:MAG: DUF6132 family protein [Bacteroidales bacterium]
MKTKIGPFLKNNLFTIIGVIIGLLGGYLYWYFVGCNSDTCPITSSPINSSLWGGSMGGLLFSMFNKKTR